MTTNIDYEKICRCYIDNCGSSVYVKIEVQNEYQHFVNFKCGKGHEKELIPLKEFLKKAQEQYQKLNKKKKVKKIFENDYHIKNIIWIDMEIDNLDYENYCNQIEDKYNIECCRCKTLAEGISIIKDFL